MSASTAEFPTSGNLDPRIRRTRELLRQGLAGLLVQKDFDKISVHEIADAASINRATFYDHYADKYALLECLVAARFHELLAERSVAFDGSCPSALRALILALCDYLLQIHEVDSSRPLQPHMESAVISVLRRMALEGMAQHPQAVRDPGDALPLISAEMLAAMLSGAIYAGAKEWLQTSGRPSSETAATAILTAVMPMFTAMAP